MTYDRLAEAARAAMNAINSNAKHQIDCGCYEMRDCDCGTDELNESAQALEAALAAYDAAKDDVGLREFFISVDSELSAIAHGRLPSDKATLLRLSDFARQRYAARKALEESYGK